MRAEAWGAGVAAAIGEGARVHGIDGGVGGRVEAEVEAGAGWVRVGVSEDIQLFAAARRAVAEPLGVGPERAQPIGASTAS